MSLVMQAIVDRPTVSSAKGPEYLEADDPPGHRRHHPARPEYGEPWTNGKYVETPFGIYELKQFFTSGVTQKDGSEMSSARILDAPQSPD